MKKILLSVFILISLLNTSVLAETFSDLPSGHWAESAVYNLVKLGVTQGYPDGTFRGNKSISRYEAATLINNIANSVGLSDEEKAKLKEEIKKELAGLGWKIDGSYVVRAKLNKIAGSNARNIDPEHRLNLSISNKGLFKGTEFTLHWDTRTMTTGRSGLANVDYMNWGNNDLAMPNAFDLYGKINLAELGVLQNTPIILEASTGLGDQWHKGDKVAMTININKLKVGGAYSRLNGVSSRLAGVNKYSLIAGYSLTAPALGPTDIAFEGNAYNTTIAPWRASANRAYNMKVTVTSKPKDYLKVQGIFGLTGKSMSGLMLGGKIWLTGLLDNKLNARVEGYKLASQYIRNSMEGWIDTDVYDDMIGDSANNSETYIGAKVNYEVNSLIGVQFRMSMYFNGAKLGTLQTSTWEPMIIFNPSKKAKIYGAYRIWRNHTAGTNSDRIETGMQVNI